MIINMNDDLFIFIYLKFYEYLYVMLANFTNYFNNL